MPRNKEDARQRLIQASLELFAERGFDQTTAAQIAARAGVTARTFFRHFPDKREVLFAGQTLLEAALAKEIQRAQSSLSAIETLRSAFAAVASLFEENRHFSEPRQRIIAVTPALQEREVAKSAAMTRMIAAALEQRGAEPRSATLAAQAGWAVLGYAFDAWFAAPSSRLVDHLDQAFEELRGLTSQIDS